MTLFELIGKIVVENGEANSSIDETSNKASGMASKLASGVKTVAKVATAVAGAATAAYGVVSAMGLNAYADYEQLAGGVKKLFGDSASTVADFASQAYVNAGMSANAYMETVTSFSAGLISSLGGDTAAAATIANTAIQDMSDNANVFGSDIGLIQNAYQGFAKQNYTMLDNLKLGYGGTKTEMERLLADANRINAEQGKMTDYSIDNLADVYEAIHVVQEEMGIAGTTASEAAGTIQGSVAMTKAAWQNLLVGFADENANMSELVQQFFESAVTAAENIVPRIGQIFKGIAEAVPLLAAQIRDKMFEHFPELEEKFNRLKGWFTDIANYASEKFGPTIENLQGAFNTVKDSVQFVIDKFSEYVSSGEAGKDATDLLKDAVDLLAGAAELVTDGLTAFTDWCSEHQGTIETIAVVVGSFAAAWGLVNGALKLWNIIGIISTAVTTAFGTAVAFLTSPITLAALAIGALIAIGVLLYKNWDTIKEKCHELAQNLKEKFNQAKEAVVQKVTELKDKAVEKFNSLKQAASEKFEAMKQAISDKVSAAKDKVSTVFSNIKSSISEKVSAAYSTVSGKFESIKDKIQTTIETARDKVKSAIDKMKSFFNFSWSLPKIKLPHFNISGSFSLNPPSVPKFSVSWYKKAMANPMLLTNPTIFGYDARSGNLLGGGEAGAEVVSGATTLMNMIQNAVAGKNEELVAVLLKILDAILALDENMGGNLREALDGMSWNMNRREFARLVKAVN